MTKTWFEKYTTWRRRSNWPIHPATEYAYHAGRKHQREAFRGEYAKIRKYYKEVDDWQDDLTEKFGVLTRERNEYRASCEALTQAVKRIDEKHMAQHIIYRQKIDECKSLTRERNDYKTTCTALMLETSKIQSLLIQNGSLKNQVRFLLKEIAALENKKSWWQKLWKVEW